MLRRRSWTYETDNAAGRFRSGHLRLKDAKRNHALPIAKRNHALPIAKRNHALPVAKRNHALPVDVPPLFDPQVDIEDAIAKAKR